MIDTLGEIMARNEETGGRAGGATGVDSEKGGKKVIKDYA